eukprot:COSAG02_NODE_3131_length_7311_cov_11.071131_2_plen_710_part_00
MDRASLSLPAVSDASPWVQQADHNANRAFFPQMIRIAKEIGIDPRRDRDYLWIAEAARDAVYEEPLPAPWQRLKPKHSYLRVPDAYYNPITRRTVTEHPALSFFRQLFEDKRKDQKETVQKKRGLRKVTAEEKARVAQNRRLKKREQIRDRAILRLQRVWRGKVARRKVQIIHEGRWLAASRMQAGFRGLMGRRALHAQRRIWAATVFQKVWRGRAYRLGDWKELKAAMFLQRAVRRYRARTLAYKQELETWVSQEGHAVRLVQNAIRRRARNQRAKRDYELLAVVDATRDDKQFFEVRRITTQKIYGMRVFNTAAAVRCGKEHLASLHHTKSEVPFLVRCSQSFQNGEKLYMVLDYHVADCRRLQYGLSNGGPFRGMADYADVVRVFAAEILLCLEGLAARGLRYSTLTTTRLRITDAGHVAVSDSGVRLAAKDDPRGPEGFVPWCFGAAMLELLTGITIPPEAAGDQDELLRKQLVKQATTLVDREAASLLKCCVLPGEVAPGLTVSELKAHPYFLRHSITFAKNELWTSRPFGLSGPTQLSGPLVIARESLSFGARQLEMRLAELTMLSARLTSSSAHANESGARKQALEIRRQRAEVESLKSVARKLRGSGRIKEYQALRRHAHIREKAVKQLESEFEPSYGWTLDDPELLRPDPGHEHGTTNSGLLPARRRSASASFGGQPGAASAHRYRDADSRNPRALSSMS